MSHPQARQVKFFSEPMLGEFQHTDLTLGTVPFNKQTSGRPLSNQPLMPVGLATETHAPHAQISRNTIARHPNGTFPLLKPTVAAAELHQLDLGGGAVAIRHSQFLPFLSATEVSSYLDTLSALQPGQIPIEKVYADDEVAPEEHSKFHLFLDQRQICSFSIAIQHADNLLTMHRSCVSSADHVTRESAVTIRAPLPRKEVLLGATPEHLVLWFPVLHMAAKEAADAGLAERLVDYYAERQDHHGKSADRLGVPPYLLLQLLALRIRHRQVSAEHDLNLQVQHGEMTFKAIERQELSCLVTLTLHTHNGTAWQEEKLCAPLVVKTVAGTGAHCATVDNHRWSRHAATTRLSGKSRCSTVLRSSIAFSCARRH
jgi:hypothetical protein